MKPNKQKGGAAQERRRKGALVRLVKSISNSVEQIDENKKAMKNKFNPPTKKRQEELILANDYMENRISRQKSEVNTLHKRLGLI